MPRQSWLQLCLPDGSHRKVWCKLNIGVSSSSGEKAISVFNSNNTREAPFMIIDLEDGMDVKMVSGTQTRFVISTTDGDYHNRDDDFEFIAPSFKAASSWLADISNSIESTKSMGLSLNNTNEERRQVPPTIDSININKVEKDDANICVLPNFEKQIRDIYNIYNPDKLVNVPNIVKLYDGEEMSLLVALQKKYSIADYSLLGGASERVEKHFFEEKMDVEGAKTTAENIAVYKSYQEIKSKGEDLSTYNARNINKEMKKEVEDRGLSLVLPDVASTPSDKYDRTNADRQNSSLPRSAMEVHMNDDRELLQEAKVSVDSVQSLIVGEETEEVSFELRDDSRKAKKTPLRNPLRIDTGDDSLLVDSPVQKATSSLRDGGRSESRGRKKEIPDMGIDSNMSAKGLFASYSGDDSMVERSPSPLRSREREVKPKKGKDMSKVKPKVNTNNARSKSRDKGDVPVEDLHEREWVGAAMGNNRYPSKKYGALDKDGDGRMLASSTSPSRLSMQYPRRASIGGKRKSWIANNYGNSVLNDTHQSFNKKLGHTHQNRNRSRIVGQNLYYVEDGDSPTRYQQFLGREDNVPFGGMLDRGGTGYSEKSRYTDDMSMGDDEIDRQLMMYMEHGSPRTSPSPPRRGRHDNDNNVQYVQEDQVTEYRQQMMEWQRGRGRSASQSGSSAGSPSPGRSGSRGSRSGSRGRRGNGHQGGSIEEKYDEEEEGPEKKPSTGFRRLGSIMNRMFFGTTAKQSASVEQSKQKRKTVAKKAVQIEEKEKEVEETKREVKVVSLQSPAKKKPTYWERIKSAISPPLKNKDKDEDAAKKGKEEEAKANEINNGTASPGTTETDREGKDEKLSNDDKEAAAKRKTILDEVGEIEKSKKGKKMASSLDRNFKFKNKGKAKKGINGMETYDSNKRWSDNLRSSSTSRRSQSPANKKAASMEDKEREKKKVVVGIKPRGRDASPWAPTSAGRSSALEASKQKQVSGIMKEKLKNRFGFCGSFGSAVVDDYLASPVAGSGGTPKLLNEDEADDNNRSQSRERGGERGRPASTPAPRSRGVVKKVKGVTMVTDSSGMFAIKKTPSFFDAMKANGRSLSPGAGGLFKGDLTDGMISPRSIGSPASRDLSLELSSPSKILGPYSNKKQTKETETAELNRMTSWLKSIQMEQYAQKLVDNGVNKISMIELLEVEDLLHAGLPLSDANRIRGGITEVIQRTRTVSEAAMLNTLSSPTDSDSGKVVSSAQKPSRIPFAIRPKRFAGGGNASSSPRGRGNNGRQALFPSGSGSSPTRHLNMNKKIKSDSSTKIGRPLFGKSDASGSNDSEAPQRKPALPKFNIVRRPSAENPDLSSATAGYSPTQRAASVASNESDIPGASSHGASSAQSRRSSRAKKQESIQQITKVRGGLAGFGSPRQRKDVGNGVIVMGQTSGQADMKAKMKQYQAVLQQKLNPKKVQTIKAAQIETRDQLQKSPSVSPEGSMERYVEYGDVESPEDVITEEERREIEEAKRFVASRRLAERSSPPTRGRDGAVSKRSVSMPRSATRNRSIHANTALFGGQYQQQQQQQLELNPIQGWDGGGGVFGSQSSPGMSPVKALGDSSPSNRLISDLYTPQVGGVYTPALQDATTLHDEMRQRFFPGSKKAETMTAIETGPEAMEDSKDRGRAESKKVARRRSLSQPLFPVRKADDDETADINTTMEESTPSKHHHHHRHDGKSDHKKYDHKEQYDKHLHQKHHLSRLKLQERLANKNKSKRGPSSPTRSEGYGQSSFADTLVEAKELPEEVSEDVAGISGAMIDILDEGDEHISASSQSSYSSSSSAASAREVEQDGVELELQLPDHYGAQGAAVVENNSPAIEYTDSAVEIEYNDSAMEVEHSDTVTEQVTQPRANNEGRSLTDGAADLFSTNDPPNIGAVLSELVQDEAEILTDLSREQPSPSDRNLVKIKETSARLAEHLLETTEAQEHYRQKKHLKDRLKSRMSVKEESGKPRSPAHSATSSATSGDSGDDAHKPTIDNATSPPLATNTTDDNSSNNDANVDATGDTGITTTVMEAGNNNDTAITDEIILPQARILLEEDMMSDTSSVSPSLASRESPIRGHAYADFEELESSMVEQEVNFTDTTDAAVEVEQHHSDICSDIGSDSHDESSMVEQEVNFTDTTDAAVEVEQHHSDIFSDGDNDAHSKEGGAVEENNDSDNDSLSGAVALPVEGDEGVDTEDGDDDADSDSSDDSSDDDNDGTVEASQGLSTGLSIALEEEEQLEVNTSDHTEGKIVTSTEPSSTGLEVDKEKVAERKVLSVERESAVLSVERESAVLSVERESAVLSVERAAIDSDTSIPALIVSGEKIVKRDSPVRAMRGGQRSVERDDAEETKSGDVAIASETVGEIVVDKSKLGNLKKKVPSEKVVNHPPLGKTPFEREVYKIYAQHNPSKLDDVPSILQKWSGRESTLLSNLKKKYIARIDAPAAVSEDQDATKSGSGAVLSETVEAAAATGPVDKSKLGSLKKKQASSKRAVPHPPLGKTPFERVVYKIYSEHNPAKLDDVPSILSKWSGRESTLLSNLRNKYVSEAPDTKEAVAAKADQAIPVKAVETPASNAQEKTGKFKPKPPTMSANFVSSPSSRTSDSKEVSFAGEAYDEVVIPEEGDKDDVQFRLSRIEAFKAKRDALARRGSGHTPASSASPTRDHVGPPRPPTGPKPPTTTNGKDTTAKAVPPQNPHLGDLKGSMSADSYESNSDLDLDELTDSRRRRSMEADGQSSTHTYADHNGPDWDASNDSGYADLTPEEIARRNLAAKAALLVAPTAPSVHLDYQDPVLRTYSSNERGAKEKFWAGPSLKKEYKEKKEKKEKKERKEKKEKI